METRSSFYFLYWCCIILISAYLVVLLSRLTTPSKTKTKKLPPPGPPRWPIIGNIMELGKMPHQDLYNLKPKYGPFLSLKLGSLDTLVVQSAKVVEQLFKHHDLSISDRKVPDSCRAHNYDQGSIAFSQYHGSNWRLLRRLVSTELMSNNRINETAGLRRKCVDAMLKSMEEDSASKGEYSGEINLTDHLFLMSFNLFGNLVLSRDLMFDPKSSKEGFELRAAIENMTFWTGKPNVAEFLPFLRWLDPQGIKRNMNRDMGKALKILSRFVKERIDESKKGSQIQNRVTKDFLDVLLDHQAHIGEEDGPDYKISDHSVLIFILEIFLTGSESASSTVEWAMTELLRNPQSMKMVKDELDKVIGLKRKVEESDINDLPYLQAVIKETLRIHPPGPLIARNTTENTNFMGYTIPKDTQVIINVWAIGRDRDSWGNDSLYFKPDRFLNSNTEYKGQNFGFLPFGAGRRKCAGQPLAHSLLHLVLASLLYSFDVGKKLDNFPQSNLRGSKR